VANQNGGTEAYHENIKLYYFYYDTGMKYLESSFNYLPNRGLYLFNYGIEILGKGIQDKNEEALKLAIEYFERSKGSYLFYDTYTHLGRAYRALWEISQKEEDLNQALENFERAVSIMPTYHQGWINYTTFLGETGRGAEGIEILAETELRYPGIIEEGVYGVVDMAISEGNTERAALAYNLASTILPNNPNLFDHVIDFYLTINRLDMAKRMLVGTAPYQEHDAVYKQTLKVLLPLLNYKQYTEAYEMMQKVLNSPPAQSSAQLHYWAVTAWLAGAQHECTLYTLKAQELGVPSQQLQPLLQLSPQVSNFLLNLEPVQNENNG
jgi:tetratricopeptide (TPR) repeat protein